MPSLDWEIKVGFPRAGVAGVDEVGRGCLAGPVVAAAVLLPEIVDVSVCPWLEKVTDSKMLSPEDRERLAPLITGWAASSAVGYATVEEIDRINIFHASHLAMQRAIEGLKIAPAHVLVDGKFKPKFFHGEAVAGARTLCESTAIIKGDLLCLSIAAASIVAKVWRDQRMAELDTAYPGYDFGTHKGYSTPAHSAALKKLGACEIHRKSFAPVAATLQDRLF
ncbi:MAG: ribonuclease HII [Bdellovibrionales bacterium GWC1_52_8]|nr:MAG: ribonuclease HII [Bdellovibrionales bacterium GWB1_52_6]OFZ03700.1 MAG: ribonuclease HII [Bdellovibrionales bacterium GWA1_52_35]OFZ37478.1 MAG: ribonuclease HII [Bdellovibrionales bacterium GWC1_52_8]HCM38788.1 ribonuclease HII [Bdellovibrionales bacterium]